MVSKHWSPFNALQQDGSFALYQYNWSIAKLHISNDFSSSSLNFVWSPVKWLFAPLSRYHMLVFTWSSPFLRRFTITFSSLSINRLGIFSTNISASSWSWWVWDFPPHHASSCGTLLHSSHIFHESNTWSYYCPSQGWNYRGFVSYCHNLLCHHVHIHVYDQTQDLFDLVMATTSPRTWKRRVNHIIPFRLCEPLHICE